MNGSTPPVFPPGLRHSTLFHIEGALRIIQRRMEAVTAERLGLCVRECLILQAASSVPPWTQGFIADCLGVNRNVMVLATDSLEKRGYVRRERRRENRREQSIMLTAKGKRTVKALEKLRAETWHEVFRPTTAEQRELLMKWGRAVIEGDAPVSK